MAGMAGWNDMNQDFTKGLSGYGIGSNEYASFAPDAKLALSNDWADGGFSPNNDGNSMFGNIFGGENGGGFDLSAGMGLANQGMKLFGGLQELGLFGGTDSNKLQEKALNEQIAASKRGYNANATSYNHQVGRADGYNARHGVGPSEKIKKV